MGHVCGLYYLAGFAPPTGFFCFSLLALDLTFALDLRQVYFSSPGFAQTASYYCVQLKSVPIHISSL